MPNPSIVALIVSKISAFIRTDGQTDMVDSASDPDQEYIYFMGSETLLLPVTYLPTNLIYPFTLRVTGIINIAYWRYLNVTELPWLLREIG